MNEAKQVVTKTVCRLKLTEERQSWEELPALNVPRRDHASCAIDKDFYVFCGTVGGC